MIFDSHVHIDAENTEPFIKVCKEYQIGALINAESVCEYEAAQQVMQSQPTCFVSFGIHPWKSKKFCSEEKPLQTSERVAALENYYRHADAIGEIGMDSVWCDIDLMIQREVFTAQLDMAEALLKPIVLHTKGQEKEIAQILRNYSVKKLLHWYSCKEHLEEYLEQDCYFTVGPDFKRNQAVSSLIERVPLDRLLVETDGAMAVQWVLERKVYEQELPGILSGTIQAIATIKNRKASEVEQLLEENFYRFLQGNGNSR
ncbi:TatD family hydrolase [Clostridium aminobutyricum]|uniref:TatD family hydrolase n=1 Tax=Clostridium aminobutyricum TaxID=33953 RepID=A0A939D5V5_CLOAM|nr:TatD family hydrolase [Clostridium aminobutyricum]MBN7771829.1 TatD family hydrolase [Clostridium aminobutyricum]